MEIQGVVEIRCAGPRIVVLVNGKKDLEAEDTAFAGGTVGLYSWGNSGVRFEELGFRSD